MSAEKKLKIFIAAAGTGGHLLSAEKIAKQLQKDLSCTIYFVGKGLEKNPFFQKKNFSYHSIQAGPINKKGLFLISITWGWIQSLFLILRKKPAIIVGFGSYHTFPFLLAAKFLRKKVILFEANCVPGKVNRFIASKKIILACQFPLEKKLQNKKIIQVAPFPFANLEIRQIKKEQKQKTLFVFGGSQGAMFFNQIFPNVCELLKKKGLHFSVIHLTGSDKNTLSVQEEYRRKNIEATVLSYTKTMETFYLKADLVICRAGALSICELLHYKKPALLVPYPYATDDHQSINGRFFEKIGGGKMIQQKTCTQAVLAKTILQLLYQEKTLIKRLLQYTPKNKIALRKLIVDIVQNGLPTP